MIRIALLAMLLLATTTAYAGSTTFTGSSERLTLELRKEFYGPVYAVGYAEKAEGTHRGIRSRVMTGFGVNFLGIETELFGNSSYYTAQLRYTHKQDDWVFGGLLFERDQWDRSDSQTGGRVNLGYDFNPAILGTFYEFSNKENVAGGYLTWRF